MVMGLVGDYPEVKNWRMQRENRMTNGDSHKPNSASPHAEVARLQERPVVVSQYLGIDPATVIRFARAGVIPGHPLRVAGRRTHWRFLISEIRDAMLARMPASTTERKPKDCPRVDLFRHKRKAS